MEVSAAESRCRLVMLLNFQMSWKKAVGSKKERIMSIMSGFPSASALASYRAIALWITVRGRFEVEQSVYTY